MEVLDMQLNNYPKILKI